MGSYNRGPSVRVAVQEAKGILQRDGYRAERVISEARIYDLVAWKRDRILLVAVRSSRLLKLSDYHEKIWQLSNIIRNDPDPRRDVEFWIYRSPGWAMWQVVSGGAIPKGVAAA